jgi:adenylate cyclase
MVQSDKGWGMPLMNDSDVTVALKDKPIASPSADDLLVLTRRHRGLRQPITDGNLVDWILAEETRLKDGVVLFDELCWRLLGGGVPIWRANLSIGTIHPQIIGVGYRWWRDGNATEEFRVKHGIERQADYLESPMRPAIERGIPVRIRLDGSESLDRYPLLRQFREAGATDYSAHPLTMTQFAGRHRVVTWATDHPGGFDDAHLAAIQAILPAFGLVVESKTLERVNSVLLGTYLGRTIGRHIIAGEVMRGHTRRLRAVLMAIDLRGFTQLADRLPGEELIQLLDDYFDAAGAAIHAHRGEILKFVGDGVLAIFDMEGQSEQMATSAALAAAEGTLHRLDVTNENRHIVGQDLIRVGIGLHLGEVIYGNVGAVDRLDFTALGPAVNLVCRLEGLTKRLERPVLLSASFAEAYGRPLLSLGFHPLKGLSEPQEVFAPV